MADYIDREALIGRLTRNLNACNPGTFSERCYQDAINTVTFFLAADVAPVVHGRWEKDGTCSHCKGLNPTYRANKWSAQFPDFPGNFDHINYCPNCGAKMDGDGNG